MPLADQLDAGFMLMDKELIDERPDVAEAWLAAELEAQKFLADPANADEIVQIALDQTEGFSAKDLRDSLYRDWPVAQGGSSDGVKLWLPFATDQRGVDLIDYATSFLHDIDAVPAAQLPEGAVQSGIAEKVLSDAGSPDGAGVVEGEKATAN